MLTRFEYLVIDLNAHDNKQPESVLLNALGDERWELVAITAANIAYFKRATTEPPDTPKARRTTEGAKR